MDREFGNVTYNEYSVNQEPVNDPQAISPVEVEPEDQQLTVVRGIGSMNGVLQTSYLQIWGSPDANFDISPQVGGDNFQINQGNVQWIGINGQTLNIEELFYFDTMEIILSDGTRADMICVILPDFNIHYFTLDGTPLVKEDTISEQDASDFLMETYTQSNSITYGHNITSVAVSEIEGTQQTPFSGTLEELKEALLVSPNGQFPPPETNTIETDGEEGEDKHPVPTEPETNTIETDGEEGEDKDPVPTEPETNTIETDGEEGEGKDPVPTEPETNTTETDGEEGEGKDPVPTEPETNTIETDGEEGEGKHPLPPEPETNTIETDGEEGEGKHPVPTEPETNTIETDGEEGEGKLPETDDGDDGDDTTQTIVGAGVSTTDKAGSGEIDGTTGPAPTGEIIVPEIDVPPSPTGTVDPSTPSLETTDPEPEVTPDEGTSPDPEPSKPSVITYNQILGNEHSNNIQGTNVADQIFAFEGNDTVFAKDGDDLVYGNSGDDMLYGGSGDDQVYASDGDDLIEGALGNDSISAGNGKDTILGGAGDDVLKKLSGEGHIDGGEGGDIIIGGYNNDLLAGGQGNDVVIGDISTYLGGLDTIEGGDGDDILMGGIGSDTFIFRPNSGVDTIAGVDVIAAQTLAMSELGFSSDWTSADRIHLIGFENVTQDTLFNHITETAQGAVFSAEGTSIVFYGITADDLNVDHFVFG